MDKRRGGLVEWEELPVTLSPLAGLWEPPHPSWPHLPHVKQGLEERLLSAPSFWLIGDCLLGTKADLGDGHHWS